LARRMSDCVFGGVFGGGRMGGGGVGGSRVSGDRRAREPAAAAAARRINPPTHLFIDALALEELEKGEDQVPVQVLAERAGELRHGGRTARARERASCVFWGGQESLLAPLPRARPQADGGVGRSARWPRYCCCCCCCCRGTRSRGRAAAKQALENEVGFGSGGRVLFGRVDRRGSALWEGKRTSCRLCVVVVERTRCVVRASGAQQRLKGRAASLLPLPASCPTKAAAASLLSAQETVKTARPPRSADLVLFRRSRSLLSPSNPALSRHPCDLTSPWCVLVCAARSPKAAAAAAAAAAAPRKHAHPAIEAVARGPLGSRAPYWTDSRDFVTWAGRWASKERARRPSEREPPLHTVEGRSPLLRAVAAGSFGCRERRLARPLIGARCDQSAAYRGSAAPLIARARRADAKCRRRRRRSTGERTKNRPPLARRAGRPGRARARP
jgi:hypothetical protein